MGLHRWCNIKIKMTPMGLTPMGLTPMGLYRNQRDPDGAAPMVQYKNQNDPDGANPDGAFVYHPMGDASDGAAYIAHFHLHYVIFDFKCHNVSCPGGVLLIVLLLYFCASLSVFDESMFKSMTDYK